VCVAHVVFLQLNPTHMILIIYSCSFPCLPILDRLVQLVNALSTFRSRRILPSPLLVVYVSALAITLQQPLYLFNKKKLSLPNYTILWIIPRCEYLLFSMYFHIKVHALHTQVDHTPQYHDQQYTHVRTTVLLHTHQSPTTTTSDKYITLTKKTSEFLQHGSYVSNMTRH